jgi:GMP synthase-like glutamine amidotransferase
MKPLLILRHSRSESPGILADALDNAGLPWQLHETWDGSFTHFEPDRWAGLVVLGGAMNTDQTDEFPFLPQVVTWLRQSLAAQLPVLGICLGAQLLAQAAGGRVHHHTVKEIGWYDIQLTPAATVDRLLEGFSSGQCVFQWHGDRFDLPPGAALLATSSTCREQAYRVGATAWGLQFHPEVTAEIIDGWLTEPAGCSELADLSYIDPMRIRAETPHRLPPMHRFAAKLFDRFATVCRTHRG